jgi:hypothetical protein
MDKDIFNNKVNVYLSKNKTNNYFYLPVNLLLIITNLTFLKIKMSLNFMQKKF